LQRDYCQRKPEVNDRNQLVAFGSSGHRGSAFHGTEGQGIDGPLYMGKDTHAASEPAQRTALELPAANGVETIIQKNDGLTKSIAIRSIQKLALLFTCVMIASTAHASSTNIFAPESTPAKSIFNLSMFVLAITGIIFVVVFALLLYSMLKFRSTSTNSDREPAQV
jgi:hypothetical protein